MVSTNGNGSNGTTSNGTTPAASAPRTRQIRAAVPDRPPRVALNLDSVQREAGAEAFVVVISGKPRKFLDPHEMDWQEVAAAMDDATRIFRLALSADDYREVMAAKIPVWKVRLLAEEYMAHYGFQTTAAS